MGFWYLRLRAEKGEAQGPMEKSGREGGFIATT
jgi:hypothetical protein